MLQSTSYQRSVNRVGILNLRFKRREHTNAVKVGKHPQHTSAILARKEVSEGGRKQKERIEPSSIGVFAVCQLRIGLRRATRIRVLVVSYDALYDALLRV